MAKLLSPDAALRPRSAADVARQISAAMLAAEAGPLAAPARDRATSGHAVGDSRVQASLTVASDSSPTASQMVGASLPVAAPPPGVAPVQVAGSASSAGAEPIVPFSLDEGISEDERPWAAARALAAQEPAWGPVVPFSLETSPSDDTVGAGDTAKSDVQEGERSGISSDDPDVGVVYDDDDDVQEQVEVGADGKLKRRRRRRRFHIPVWYRSAMARKMSRRALVPLVALLIVAAAAGVFFYREWAATRAESTRQNALRQAEAARRAAELRPPKPPEPPPCRRASWW